MSDTKHTPKPCGAVFRGGVNTPVSCALRFNHSGPHRTWGQVADERDELLEALKLMTPAPDYPKCLRGCASNVASYDEDPRCDCGFEEIRMNAGQARAAIAKAEGKE